MLPCYSRRLSFCTCLVVLLPHALATTNQWWTSSWNVTILFLLLPVDAARHYGIVTDRALSMPFISEMEWISYFLLSCFSFLFINKFWRQWLFWGRYDICSHLVLVLRRRRNSEWVAGTWYFFRRMWWRCAESTGCFMRIFMSHFVRCYYGLSDMVNVGQYLRGTDWYWDSVTATKTNDTEMPSTERESSEWKAHLIAIFSILLVHSYLFIQIRETRHIVHCS